LSAFIEKVLAAGSFFNKEAGRRATLVLEKALLQK
jgi:hypothetical protein